MRQRFESAWGTELDPNRGLTVTEIIGSVLKGGVRGMYMMGENPFLSDPNINKVRKALSALDFLVVQDIFITETAEFADVILPATSYLEKDGTYTNTDRRVQLGRKVLDPPGQARADWEVTQDIANRMGLGWTYESPRRGVRRDGRADAELRQPQLRQPRLDRQALPQQRSRAQRRDRRDVRRAVQHRRRPRTPGAGRVAARRGAARRGVPVRAQHRAAARALAHRLDDAALVRPRRHRARRRGLRARRRRRRLGLRDGELARVTSRRGSIELPSGCRHGRHPATCSSRSTSARRPPTCSPPTRSTRSARSPSSSSAPWRSRRRPRQGYDRDRPPVPGVEGRNGKFPGPSLIPALNAIQERVGWLPREELVALSQGHPPAAVRDPGAGLVLPALPHRAAAAGGHARLPRPDLLAARMLTTGSPPCAQQYGDERRRGAGRGVLPGPLRQRARGGGQRRARPRRRRRRRWWPGPGRVPPRRSRAPVHRPLAEPWPNDPYAPRIRDGSATGCCARCWPGDLDAGRWCRPCRTPGCAAWAVPGSPPGRSGSWSPTRRPRPSTPSATPTSPSRGRSRTARSSATRPHLVLEGLLLGMAVVGAEEGFVFIRHEYGPEADVVRDEIDRLRTDGLLGDDVLGSGRRLQVELFVVARRLHPRRGVRTAGVHGGSPRRAAQQAAVPRCATACGASRR